MIRYALTLALGVAWVAQPPQQPPFTERVDVARVIVDVRVVDDKGLPIPGLGVDDFAARLGGRALRVESVSWTGPPRHADSDSDRAVLPSSALMPAGRLIVLLFQKDLEPTRVVGLMRMLLQAQSFLDTLTPDDRVAVLSFDSHLKIWLDFTSDRESLRRVVEHDILMGKPAAFTQRGRPSLLERLSRAEGQRTYAIEKGLRLIAEAVRALPGSKSIVLVGHGFGRFGPLGVTMENGYDEAIDALLDARVSVFSLDVTQADYHSLEAGLQLVSSQTGGFYARTHLFSGQAMRRLAGALAGHYVLLVERPAVLAERPEIDVELTRVKGHVLARSAFP
jgi:VWFA-related protein